MSYTLEIDKDKIEMEQLKKIDKLCGGGIFEETAGKVIVTLMQPLIYIFDLFLKIFESTPLYGPFTELKNIILNTLAEGHQTIQIVTVEEINGKMHYTLNSDNPLLKVFADLIRALLPFAASYTFEQIAAMFAPGNVGDTLVMIFGAMLGYICLAEKKSLEAFSHVIPSFNLTGGSRVQKGGLFGVDDAIILGILLIGVIGIAAVVGGVIIMALALLLIAVVVITLAILLFLTVVVIGLLWFFHDSIIWGITYLGNILLTFILMVPVYIIAFKSNDSASLDKALLFMKEVPVNEPYKNMNNMTQQYNRSMESYDDTVGGIANKSIDTTGQLGMEGVGQMGTIGQAGSELSQTGVTSSTSAISSVAGMGSAEDIAGMVGGAESTADDFEKFTFCGVVNKAKFLDPSKAKPQDLINAIGALKPSDFAGPLHILGQILILFYAVIFNYDSLKDSIDAGTIKISTPTEIHAMLSNALGADSEQVKKQASAFEQINPQGSSINSIAKQPTVDDLQDALSKVTDPNEKVVLPQLLAQLGIPVTVEGQTGGLNLSFIRGDKKKRRDAKRRY
jgi:hypothetical protein